MGARHAELSILLSTCLAATGALGTLGCGKTDVALGANGRPLAMPAWDAPTPGNGFRPVVPELPKCPSQGYEMRGALGYYPDETAGEPR